MVIHKAVEDISKAPTVQVGRDLLALVKVACGETIKWEKTYANGVSVSWEFVTCPACLLHNPICPTCHQPLKEVQS